jgi:CheY-like chemotaxis protein/nitrogen-specific signal transduction histidine kinase
VGIVIVVDFFKRENDKIQDLLRKEKKQVLKDKALLEKQKMALKELNKFKTHFFTNISHEIRTPITLINGYANRITLEENSENSKLVDIIKTQAENIKNIVDSLLDLTKLDANKLTLNIKEEDVIVILGKLLTDYERPFKDKNILFELDCTLQNVLVAMDKRYFLKSLQNLIGNALKFSNNGGRIIIKIEYNENLKISITDNGIGIPEKDQKEIFKRFFQSKNHINNSLGSGIGLSFAKNILNAHGFSLEVQSIPNEETTFTITIPDEFVNFHSYTVEDNNEIEIASSSKNILVVEDNVEMKNYLKLVLKSFNVIEASHGKEALQILDKTEVSAIITDYMMPFMDGLQFVKILKEKSIKIPVIVLTARNDNIDKLNMLRIGIDGYYTKPFIEEELLLKLKQSIRYYEKLKQHENNLPLYERQEISGEQNTFYKELIGKVDENINNKNFGVDNLAEFMGLSRSSLFRKTKYILGQTPNEVIKEARFQKARRILLENPKIKKKELAEAVGIYNASYFYENLKSRFNIN